MKVRATVHLQPDALGFAPVPGMVFDIDPKAPGVERHLNVGNLVPVEPLEPTPEHTAGVASESTSAEGETPARKPTK